MGFFEFNVQLAYSLMAGLSGAGVVLALTLRSARLIRSWVDAAIVAAAWPLGILILIPFRPHEDILLLGAGFVGGAATFWILQKSAARS